MTYPSIYPTGTTMDGSHVGQRKHHDPFHKNLVNKKISDKPLVDDTIIAVTWEGEIIWEYISPYWGSKMNMIYRSYRVPYEWVPQLDKPEEIPIEPIDLTTFRVPGASEIGPQSITEVEGSIPFRGEE